jgi:hypothetical protein
MTTYYPLPFTIEEPVAYVILAIVMLVVILR